MNASTKGLWLASVVAAGFGGGLTGAIVAERPAVAAIPAQVDPALPNLLRYVRVDDGGNVTIAASNLTISGSNVSIKAGASMQLVSGGQAQVKAGAGLSLVSGGVTDVEGGAQTTIKGGVVTICCPSR
jgi:hypothetical protein